MTAQQHIDNRLFLTDGGLETTLVFHRGIDLPHFASFPLLESEEGREELRNYYQSYLDIARGADCGFVLESPTWRSNTDWGERLGYNAEQLAEVNRYAMQWLGELRAAQGEFAKQVLLSGAIGQAPQPKDLRVARVWSQAPDQRPAASLG